ncbi:MAG: TonB-dependent receptor plug domain-containing protein, partial [Gemmatimonadaceae bacterium]|nr:TonB-dependent receptor plug domain-containing protein [Gemmatimonadaceae bacterium]
MNPARVCALAATCAAAAACPTPLRAQPRDSTTLRDTLATVRIIANRPFAAGPIESLSPRALAAGKRTDRLSLAQPATLALNSTRQAFARAPGVMVWEQDAGGLQAGVAIRGLSPNRSWEFNTRQNGLDIAADIAGYPEAYYTPPFEGLERIELVRGAAALQYGAQFGGLLNYVTKGPPAGHQLTAESSQLGGSNGLYSTYSALGGQTGRVGWYVALNHRQGNGWRQAARFDQHTLLLRTDVHLSPSTRLAASLTRMDYRLRQPGGLTDAQFGDDARQARRTRDWFGAPWLIPTLSLEHWLDDATALTISAFGLEGQRNSVGAIVAPTVADAPGAPRRVDRDRYANVGTEARLVRAMTLGGRPAAIVGGVRATLGTTTRWRARGTGGDDFSLDLTAPRTLDLRFRTTTAAAFTELTLPLADGVALVPGARLESIRMRGDGSVSAATGSFDP